MKNKTGLLLLMLLILTHSSFAQQSDSIAPEATAAESTLSFWDIPDLKKAYIDTTPRDRKDGISVGELGTAEGKDMIVKMAKEIAEGKHGNYDGLLISHKNKLVFESYYKKGRVNLPHGQASAVKAYTSLILGRAIQLGYLTMADLDKPLVNFLKDLNPTRFVEGAEKITLHKALTMHGGLSINNGEWEEIKKDSVRLKGQGLVHTLLEHSGPITSASQTYLYGNFNPMLVMTVIDAVVPGTAEDFIKNELIDKMGISNYSWENHVSGLPQAGWMVSMTSRDMLKWGNLVLNKGKWNGEQLISVDYLNKATSGIVKPTEDWMPETYRYGYFWYQTPLMVGNKSYNTTFAWGGGGQRVIVIKELDLIIVITGHDSEDTIMTQVSKAIIPAFVKDDFPPFEDRYLGQKPPGLIPELFAPGIVSTEEYLETVVTFLPDMRELQFTRSGGKYKEPTLFVMQNKNNRWSRKSIPSTDINKYKERFNPSVSEMKSLEPFKDIPITGFSVSSKDTYYFYFIDFSDGGSGHMSYSRLIDGKYETPQKMSKAINTGKYIAHPFIAPDESYLMWDAEIEGKSTPDIYISFRQNDGSWGAAINMGDKINTPLYEQHARVTPDGKYLFFWKGDVKVREDGSRYVIGSPYWVDAKIIETLRPK